MTATDVFYRNVAKRYPTAARGAGVYIFDDAGKRYLDGCSGALVANLGHGRRELFADLAPAELDFFHTSQFTNVAQERLARALAELTPPGLRHTYFVSGGSEANETALKIAYQYHRHRGNPGKTRIVSKNPSYHGNTLGALGASVHRGRRRPVEALLAKPISVEPQLCAGCRYLPSCDACATAWAAAFERAILAAGPETVGTFICETVTGSSCAAYAPPAAFFGAMRAICDRHDIVYIADEVMCGMGRTGTPFAIQQMGVAPDIITTAKGISAGYAPLGAAIVHDRIFKVFLEHGTFNHGFTNVGSPIATAIGSRVLATYRAGDLFAQAAARGQRLRARLDELATRHPIIGEVRGRGLMLGLELVVDRDTGRSFSRDAGVAEHAARIAFERGLIVYAAGEGATEIHRDQILLGPPFIISEVEIDELATLLDDTLNVLEAAVSVPAG